MKKASFEIAALDRAETVKRVTPVYARKRVEGYTHEIHPRGWKDPIVIGLQKLPFENEAGFIWNSTDLTSGRCIKGGFDTRKEALDNALALLNVNSEEEYHEHVASKPKVGDLPEWKEREVTNV